MGIGIVKNSTSTVWEIPLTGFGDDKWQDNTWIVEHLRQLADKIENENPVIYHIGLKMNHQYNSPTLIFDVFEKK